MICKNKNRVRFCLIIFIFLLSTMLVRYTEICPNNKIKSKDIHYDLLNVSYIVSSPITIDGNQDFQTQAGVNGWNGSGDEGDPYILKNLNISSIANSISLISISNTKVYFTIQGNLLEGGSSGIEFHNVTNGIIKNTTILTNSDYGILIHNSTAVIINNNTIHDSTIGVYFFSSMTNVLKNNTIYSHDTYGFLCDNLGNNTITINNIFNNGNDGIKFRDSPSNIVSNNTVFNNNLYGISFANSEGNTVTNNIVFNNIMGINLEISKYCNITDNLVYDNSDRGISCDNSGNTIIRSNIIYNNYLFGIRINFGDNYNISENNFISNGQSIYQVHAIGTNITYIYNYWDDWVMPDDDNDGYVDYPYQVEEIYQDPFPLSQAYVYGKIHLLTIPVIWFPDDGVISGISKIKWGIASDLMGHNVNYSLYYSPDVGLTWNLIVENLLNNSYDWNTTILSDDYQYMVKVVASCSDGLITEDISDTTFVIGNSAHTLSIPEILTPLGGNLNDFPVFIEWTASNDSWGFPVSYTVYSSANNGNIWYNITSNITATQCYWDVDSRYWGTYLLKVVAHSLGGITAEAISSSLIVPEQGIGMDTYSFLFFSISIMLFLIILRIKKKIRKK